MSAHEMACHCPTCDGMALKIVERVTSVDSMSVNADGSMTMMATGKIRYQAIEPAPSVQALKDEIARLRAALEASEIFLNSYAGDFKIAMDLPMWELERIREALGKKP